MASYKNGSITLENVYGKKTYETTIVDCSSSTDTDWLKELLDIAKDASFLFADLKAAGAEVAPVLWGSLTNEILQNALKYDTTSSVTNMSGMFAASINITAIPLFNTSLVTNMSMMFAYCTNLATIPQLDTSKVTDMSSMFEGCSNLTTIPQIDTSKVTSMGYMFNQCSNLTTIPQLDTSNVTNMEWMFANCDKLTTIPQLDTSSVTNMSSMFAYCYILTKIDITHMNIASNLYSSNFAFNCHSLTKLIIRNMPTIPVLDSNALPNCYHFTGTVNTTYNPEGLKDGRIYVPDDKVEELKVATNWSVYADIIVPLSTLVE